MKKFMLIVLVGLMGASQVKAGDWGDWAVPAGVGAASMAAGVAASSYLNRGCQARVAELEELVETLNRQVAELNTGMMAAMRQGGGAQEVLKFNEIIQNLGTAMLDDEAREAFINALDLQVVGVPIRRVLEIYRENLSEIEAGVERVLRQRGAIS